MASIQEKNRDETGESSRKGFHPVQGISFQSQSSASNENIEELQIPQRPCPKSQRKIVPTEKARKICDFCQKTFAGGDGSGNRIGSNRDYQIHVRRCRKYHKFVMGEKLNQCSLCPDEKEFSCQKKLFLHFEKMHSDIIKPENPRKFEISDEPKDCEICETTVLKQNWTNHWKHCQKYRGLIQKLQCLPCKKNYGSRSNLLTHVRVSHKDLLNKDGNVQAEPKAKTPKNLPKSSKLSIECPNCQNLFENEDKLFDHVETCNAPPETEEGGEKIPPSLLTCIWRLDNNQVCGKSFSRKENLKTHLRIHRGEKPFSCNQCEMNFRQKAHLEKHERSVHETLNNVSEQSSELPKLECPNCQNLFEDEDMLNDHVKTCTAGTPPEPEIDPLISAPTVKQCSFCDDLVPKKNLLEHLERCSKAADLIIGIKCTKCPQKQFKSKHEVYGHVHETHLANVQDEVVNQNDKAEEDMDGVEEEIPQKGIEPGIQGIKIVETYGNPPQKGIEPGIQDIKIVETCGNPPQKGIEPGIQDIKIVETCGNPPQKGIEPGIQGIKIVETYGNPNGGHGTSLVRKDYFNDVDPYVITRLFICPLCRGKLGFKEHVQTHLVVFHNIDVIAFKNLNLHFEQIPI